jgi:hypothetical protein
VENRTHGLWRYPEVIDNDIDISLYAFEITDECPDGDRILLRARLINTRAIRILFDVLANKRFTGSG